MTVLAARNPTGVRINPGNAFGVVLLHGGDEAAPCFDVGDEHAAVAVLQQAERLQIGYHAVPFVATLVVQPGRGGGRGRDRLYLGGVTRVCARYPLWLGPDPVAARGE
jgi:hypothetical protein